jgi:hypothetical protein
LAPSVRGKYMIEELIEIDKKILDLEFNRIGLSTRIKDKIFSHESIKSLMEQSLLPSNFTEYDIYDIKIILTNTNIYDCVILMRNKNYKDPLKEYITIRLPLQYFV